VLAIGMSLNPPSLQVGKKVEPYSWLLIRIRLLKLFLEVLTIAATGLCFCIKRSLNMRAWRYLRNLSKEQSGRLFSKLIHTSLHLPFQAIAFPIKISKSPYQYRSQKSEKVWKRGGIVLARTPYKLATQSLNCMPTVPPKPNFSTTTFLDSSRNYQIVFEHLQLS